MSMNLNERVVYRDPMDLVFDNAFPSSDEAVRSRKQHEVLPREGGLFGSKSGNGVYTDVALQKRLRFYLSDPAHYIDMMNSYIGLDFDAAISVGDPADLTRQNLLSLDEGGLASLIKTLKISIGSAELCRIDEFAKWYNACVRNSKYSSEFVNRRQFNQADDVGDGTTSVNPVNIPITFDSATATYVVNANPDLPSTLNLGAGAAVIELEVGDKIEVQHNDGGFRVGVVERIVSNNIILIDLKGPTLNNANDITRITKILPASSRGLACAGADATKKLTFNLPVGALQIPQYFPLPLIQNYGPLEIDIELHDANLALVVSNRAIAEDANTSIGYRISRPYFIASLVEPGKIMDVHKEMFNSTGMLFHYKNWRHFQNSVTDSEQNFVKNYQTNIVSAKGVVSVLTDQKTANTDSPASRAFKSQSTFERLGLNRYRYRNGGLRFPEYDYVDVTDDEFGAEAYDQYKLTMGLYNNRYDTGSIAPYEWRGFSSNKFIISTNMAKHPDLWCGVNLSNAYLELEVELDSAPGVNVALHSWICYDTILMLGKSGVKVIY